jgi:hypothetical protein
VPGHPHNEGWRARKHTCVLLEGRLLRCIDRDQEIGNVEIYGVAFEEVGEVDEILAAFGVTIGDKLVVGQ